MNPNDGKLTLVIGNRNYSSWSLRVWIWMRQRGLVFDVVRVPLFEEQTDALLQGYFSGNKVPVLQHGERVIWDSLAILEYLNETFPHTKGWP
ncbi:MAG: glutathione S-transferase N-terminal domain-containing protein, partial [Chromatiales bacterium]